MALSVFTGLSKPAPVQDYPPCIRKKPRASSRNMCVTNLLNEQLFSEENYLQLRFKVLPAGAPSVEDQ